MPRTIVRVQEGLRGETSIWLESPRNVPLAGRPVSLDLAADATPFKEMRDETPLNQVVAAAGDQLFQKIVVHPAVMHAFQTALQALNGNCSPICFRLDDTVVAENLPWEALRDPGADFLALDRRWPVVRVRDVTESEPVLEYSLQPPLRLLGVLSAAGSSALTRASAQPELQKVLDTFQQYLAKPNALPVRVYLLLGEESVRDAARAMNLPWLTADLIADKADLLNKIRVFAPHLLHFFCHGTTEEIPHLQIGSRMDWELDQDGSIAVTAKELSQQADPDQGVWLVTLNCCESAARTRDARSLASSLVASGFPTAIGMREAVNVQLAHLLCGQLYPAILKMLSAVPENGPVVEIEWACVLYDARAALVNQCTAAVPVFAARECKYWTIPVLYTRREPFRFKRLPVSVISPEKLRLAQKLQVLQQQRTKIAQDFKDLPPAALQGILADLDTEIGATVAQLSA
jgi:hypothetical protein